MPGSREQYRDWRVRGGAVFAMMFGFGLLLRLWEPLGRSSAAELWAYAAIAGVGLAVLAWGLLARRDSD